MKSRSMFHFKRDTIVAWRSLLQMRSALFWDITQRLVEIVYRRFGTTYQSHLQGSRTSASCGSNLPTFRNNVSSPSSRVKDVFTSKMGPMLSETSVKDFHTTPRNTPEERRSHQHRGGSLRSSFILHRRVQTDPGAISASCPVGTAGIYARVKATGARWWQRTFTYCVSPRPHMSSRHAFCSHSLLGLYLWQDAHNQQ
jgi:hypothetical protein